MNGEVFDKKDGLPVEVVSGDVLDVVDTVGLMPDWNDDKFSEVKIG